MAGKKRKYTSTKAQPQASSNKQVASRSAYAHAVRASLATLPVELKTQIAAALGDDLVDIGNLRLVNRSLSECAIVGTYKDRIENQSIQLEETALQKFSEVLTHSSLARNIKQITITLPIYELPRQSDAGPLAGYPAKAPSRWMMDPFELGDDSGDDRRLVEMQSHAKEASEWQLMISNHNVKLNNDTYVKLLRSCFTALHANASATGSQLVTLDTVRLDCARVDHTGKTESLDAIQASKRDLPAQCATLFAIVINALLDSKLHVAKLDLFYDTLHTGLPVAAFIILQNQRNRRLVKDFFQGVTELSVGISRYSCQECAKLTSHGFLCYNDRYARHPHDGVCAIHLASFEEDGGDRSCHSGGGFQDFLPLVSNLSKLCLKYYEVSGARSGENPNISLINPRAPFKLHKLRHLDLGGFQLPINALAAILKTHPDLKSLALRSIDLKSGQWQPVLDKIRTWIPNLATMALHSLTVGRQNTPCADRMSISDESASSTIEGHLMRLGSERETRDIVAEGPWDAVLELRPGNLHARVVATPVTSQQVKEMFQTDVSYQRISDRYYKWWRQQVAQYGPSVAREQENRFW